MSALAFVLAVGLAHAVSPPAAAEASAPPPGPTAIQAGLVLQVDDRAAALATAVSLARAEQGWFARLSDDAVTLRVPVAEAPVLVDRLDDLGVVVERSFSREDLGPTRVDLTSRIAAREAVLARYFAVLTTAGPDAVVSVEREITRAVSELEGLQGRLRVLDDRANFAVIEVGFRYRDRTPPRRSGDSPFPFLESLNVAELLADFESGRLRERSRVAAVAPAGFAPFRPLGRFRAASPDDVVYRVRAVRNKPAADLAFWEEALRTRMEGAGYRVVQAQRVDAGGVPGAVLELGAVNGTQDQTYLVALFVDGGRLVLVEATGERGRFAARREAVFAALGQIRF